MASAKMHKTSRLTWLVQPGDDGNSIVVGDGDSYQTYEYIEKSHSDYWSPAQIAESNRLQQFAGLPAPPGAADTMVASTGGDPALTTSPS